jgi:hypothetical protein
VRAQQKMQANALLAPQAPCLEKRPSAQGHNRHGQACRGVASGYEANAHHRKSAGLTFALPSPSSGKGIAAQRRNRTSTPRQLLKGASAARPGLHPPLQGPPPLERPSSLSSRHNHRSHPVPSHFPNAIRCPGSLSSPVLVRQTDATALAKRASRTLKQQRRWLERCASVAKLGQAVECFAADCTASWGARQPHGQSAPNPIRHDHECPKPKPTGLQTAA